MDFLFWLANGTNPTSRSSLLLKSEQLSDEAQCE